MISLYLALGAMLLTTSGTAAAATGPQPDAVADVAWKRRDDDDRERDREARRARREAEARRRQQGADPGRARPAAPSPRDPRR